MNFECSANRIANPINTASCSCACCSCNSISDMLSLERHSGWELQHKCSCMLHKHLYVYHCTHRLLYSVHAWCVFRFKFCKLKIMYYLWLALYICAGKMHCVSQFEGCIQELCQAGCGWLVLGQTSLELRMSVCKVCAHKLWQLFNGPGPRAITCIPTHGKCTTTIWFSFQSS